MDRSNTDLLELRQKIIGDKAPNSKGECVLYVMRRDKRVRDNFALLAAQKRALELKLPLAVIFCVHPQDRYHSYEYYTFMLDGLKMVESELKKCHIPLMALIGPPLERLKGAINHLQPTEVFIDFSPLRGPRQLTEELASDVSVKVVDTRNIVPVWVASNKQEIGARTLRPKIHRLLPTYLQEPEQIIEHPYTWPGPIITFSGLATQMNSAVSELPRNMVDHNFGSGEVAAHVELQDFITDRLPGYAQNRNDPTKSGASNLSPYLHFGQISSLRVALEVMLAVNQDASLQADTDAFIEELVVRRELSDNFCYYNTNYDSLTGTPTWAQLTLAKHADDPREFIYSKTDFENAKTHDTAWNAAQNQLLKTGKIHGYMRMYWAKKVLEWSVSPEVAIDTLIYLNDFYSIDGGDPNGYVGILWSVAGLHDRPWGERPVYGTIRSMVYGGLKRKFDIATYETMWS